MEEVNELSRKISAHEEHESRVADQILDTEWEKVEKKQNY